MSHFLGLTSAVMDVGVHVHLFRSVLQFKTWYELLVGKFKDVVKEEDVVEAEQARSHTTTVFKVEANTLPYVRAAGIYYRYLLVKRLKDMSVTEYAIQIGRKCVSAGEMLGRVDYTGVLDVASAHHGFTNMASNVSQIFVDDVVHGNNLT